jgi:lysophospholipase L1-like esterase
MNWETLLCLGDSITIGSRSYLGYPEYAGAQLEKVIGNRWNVVNHATCGFKAIDLHRSMTLHYCSLQQFQPSLATIMIGTNDLKGPTSLEDYRLAYKQIILKTRLLLGNTNIVLLHVPHLPSQVKYPYRSAMNPQVDAYNRVIDSLAEQFELQTLAFEITDEDLFDGVHLNDIGAKSVGKQLASYILTDKGVYSHAGTPSL